jgi:hypothetical protein
VAEDQSSRVDPSAAGGAAEATASAASRDRQGSAAREVSPPSERSERIDPAWPEDQPGDHPVSELAADRQGSLSPFGSIVFPVDASELPYEHPHTEINWE